MEWKNTGYYQRQEEEEEEGRTRRGDVASAADTDDAQVLLLAVFLLLIPLLLMVVNGKEWKNDRVINHSEGFLCLRIFSPHRRQFHSIEDGDILGMWRTT